MKKVIKFAAVGAALFASLNASAAINDAWSVAHGKGMFKDGMSAASPVADFQTCKVSFRGEVDNTAETIHCQKGKQFSLTWEGQDGFTVATYVKDGNTALVSQTRVGFPAHLQTGIGIGTISTVKAK